MNMLSAISPTTTITQQAYHTRNATNTSATPHGTHASVQDRACQAVQHAVDTLRARQHCCSAPSRTKTMDGENDPTRPASEHLMPCPLFTEASWLTLELYEYCPASAPPGTPQPERIPLDAFAIGGHSYQYVPRTRNEEHCHFEAGYGAVDHYLVTKVLPE